METPNERRERVTAIVAAKWPQPLSPNRFVNAILDIVRGEAFAESDIPEAVDALAWRHLGESIKWGQPKIEGTEKWVLDPRGPVISASGDDE